MSAWKCPYCHQNATITSNNVSTDKHTFEKGNKEKIELWLQTAVVVCPNDECREYTIRASLWKTALVTDPRSGTQIRQGAPPELESWTLRPKSKAKPFPAYIPAPLLADYQEACVIVNDSPKASATLSRRCLQGMIRDYWGISKSRLIDEIKELHLKVDPATWSAIDAVRSIGNIGAHMEKDINLIIDVDPGEAEILIQLLETLFRDWYITRHDRAEQMQHIVAIAQGKMSPKVV